MNIIDYKPGMKITTACAVRGMPNEIYHGDCCDGPSVSATGLKQVISCPVKYWAYSPFNPKPFPRKKKPAKELNLGSAAHDLALGEGRFAEKFIVSPFDSLRTKEAKAWRDEQTKTILSSDEFETIELMAHGLRFSPQLHGLFDKGECEISLFWKDKETGVWLKARVDWLPFEPEVYPLIEYKTARTIDPWFLSNSVFRLGYNIQACLQMDSVEEVFGIDCAGIGHAVQEKDPPYLAELRLFSSEQLDMGRRSYQYGVRRFADCMNKGNWPGYTSEVSYFETPFHVAKAADALAEADGEFDDEAEAA